MIDRGVFVVTNQRCLFIGSKRSTEWAYNKLFGYTIFRNHVTLFNVNNRQKATGVQYSRMQETMLAHAIAASIASFNGEQAYQQLLVDLSSDVLEARTALAARGGAAALPPSARS